MKTFAGNKTALTYLLPGLLLAGLLFSCDSLKPVQKNKYQADKIWVHLSIRYNTNDGYQFNYYYGEIDKGLYESIANNIVTKGFIRIENLRFWNMEDKMEIYEDKTEPGIKIFRIEDILKISVQKGDPIDTYDKEELTEKALKERNRRELAAKDTTTGAMTVSDTITKDTVTKDTVEDKE